MRKILLALAVVLILAIAVLTIFIVTFDADRFRPLLVNALQERLGRPVTLRRIALGWQGGIAIQLHGFAVADEAAADAMILRIDTVNALVRFRPLLRRRVEVSSIVLERPEVFLWRDASGRLNASAFAAVPMAGGSSAPPAGAGLDAPPPESPGGEGVSPMAVSLNVESLRIRQGTLHWRDEKTTPPTELVVNEFEVVVEPVALDVPMQVEARGKLGAQASRVYVRGQLTLPTDTAPGSLEEAKLAIERFPVETLLPPPMPGRPHLRGTMTVVLEGRVGSLDRTQWLREVAGGGQVQFGEMVIVNLNMLRTVMSKLSMIPGLAQRLEERLPPEYRRQFAARDTVLAPTEVSVRFRDGGFQFDELRIRSETFEIRGAGRIHPDGTVEIPSPSLRINRGLSSAIVSSVHELQVFANSNGEIELPMIVQGRLPQVAVAPDLNAIASKVVVTTAIDLLGNLIHQGTQRTESLGGVIQRGGAQTTDTLDGVNPLGGVTPLGGILRRILDRAVPAEKPAEPRSAE